MKIAIVTDTHFGVRGESEAFDNSARLFFTEQFFPYLKKHGIAYVFHLGDLFDRRKFVNYQMLANCKEYFLDPVEDFRFKIIPGNHDVYYKNTNKVNSLMLLLMEYNFNVVQNPCEFEINDRKIAMIPWITEDNMAVVEEFLKKTDATVCMGHFDIVGFKMNNSQLCEHGLDPAIFNKFELTLTGHFHHKSNKGKIHYLGCPYEQTWDDFEDPKGFHILDTETLELEFIQNPNVMHRKIYYDDSVGQTFDYKSYKGTIVKLVVVHKTDYAAFDALVDKLYAVGVLDLKIIEDLTEFEDSAIDDNINLEDTKSILSDYIDDADIKVEKGRLKTMMNALYIEAQNMESV
jgi:DNA repair exonuclease SbcCD nuclease subunit